MKVLHDVDQFTPANYPRTNFSLDELMGLVEQVVVKVTKERDAKANNPFHPDHCAQGCCTGTARIPDGSSAQGYKPLALRRSK